MMIRRIDHEAFAKAVRGAFEACDGRKLDPERGRAALRKLWAMVPEEGSGFRVVLSEEEEIDSLLLPFLRRSETPLVAVITVARDVPLCLLNGLPAIRRNTAAALVIPLERERESVTLYLMPVADRLREKFAVDGLMASLFPRNRGGGR